jgi:hypothetical protein
MELCMKNKTPGKWLGNIAFFYIMFALTFSFIITIINPEIAESIYKLDLIAFGVFSIVWAAVYGSGHMKKQMKIKGIQDDSEN